MSLWLGTVLMIADTVLLAILLAGPKASAPGTGIARVARLPGFWVAAVLGGSGLWVTLKVQPPIQIAYGRWIGQDPFAGESLRRLPGSAPCSLAGLCKKR